MADVTGIIGGSGFLMDTCGELQRECAIETPYGVCSAPLRLYRCPRGDRVFIARHGIPHALAPHLINYRANIWALREFGCRRVIAINTVGGIGPAAVAGAIVVPDQIVDYTYGRAHTFADGSDPLLHIDFSYPYSGSVREQLLAAASAAGVAVISRGTYGATQGPRLETAAEINRMERDGCDIVGMTGMPEAALARELGIEEMTAISRAGAGDIAAIVGALD